MASPYTVLADEGEPDGGGDSGTFSCQWDGTSCLPSSDDTCEDGFAPSESACGALEQSQCEAESFACGVDSDQSTATTVSLGLAERVTNFYNYALGLGALLALGVILYGGLAYSASAGNPSRITEAKEWIKHAIFGLILLFSIFIFLQILNPDLLNLEEILLEQNPDLIVSDIPAIEGRAVRDAGEAIGGIGSNFANPPGMGGSIVDGYYQLPASSDGSYIRGSQGGADASCGKRELITVIYAVAQRWKAAGNNALVVRDLNGGILNSGVNHETHDRGVDVDIDVSGLSNSERIELAKLFADTNMVTGIIHSNLSVMNAVNTYFRLKDNGITPWKGGEFMRWLDGSNGPTHTSHFHVRIGDGDGASGTGINPGPCNTSCTRNTTCNRNAQLIGNASL